MFPQGVIVSVVFSQGVIVFVCVPQGVIVYEVVGVAPAPSYFHLNTTTGVISPRVDLMVDTTQNYVVSVGGQSVATTQNYVVSVGGQSVDTTQNYVVSVGSQSVDTTQHYVANAVVIVVKDKYAGTRAGQLFYKPHKDPRGQFMVRRSAVL